LIAGAFPGLFDYDRLLRMEVRELAYWEAKATRKTLEDRLSAIQAARMTMADPDFYRVELMKIEWGLKLLDKTMESK
jgi:hypothetical protein